MIYKFILMKNHANNTFKVYFQLASISYHNSFGTKNSTVIELL